MFNNPWHVECFASLTMASSTCAWLADAGSERPPTKSSRLDPGLDGRNNRGATAPLSGFVGPEKCDFWFITGVCPKPYSSYEGKNVRDGVRAKQWGKRTRQWTIRKCNIGGKPTHWHVWIGISPQGEFGWSRPASLASLIMNFEIFGLLQFHYHAFEIHCRILGHYDILCLLIEIIYTICFRSFNSAFDEKHIGKRMRHWRILGEGDWVNWKSVLLLGAAYISATASIQPRPINTRNKYINYTLLYYIAVLVCCTMMCNGNILPSQEN